LGTQESSEGAKADTAVEYHLDTSTKRVTKLILESYTNGTKPQGGIKEKVLTATELDDKDVPEEVREKIKYMLSSQVAESLTKTK